MLFHFLSPGEGRIQRYWVFPVNFEISLWILPNLIICSVDTSNPVMDIRVLAFIIEVLATLLKVSLSILIEWV